MIKREALKILLEWKERADRKPLVIRGARQVGKTTLVDMFSENFEQYIYLNLEIFEERRIFESQLDFDDVLASIFLIKNKIREKETLVFIDEIQNSPQAIALLRYFYEKCPQLYVLAAGSLLDALIGSSHINFPVGRVEYLVLRPFSFMEFLSALDEDQGMQLLSTHPVPEYAHEKLISLFTKYILIGGMPEAVMAYGKNRDVTDVNRIFENLITGYLEDVEKYSHNEKQTHVIRHLISTVFYKAADRIVFEGFGNGPYRSREVGECFRLLEKTLLLVLVYPCTGYTLPLLEDKKKAPRLQLLDTGLVNFMTGIQSELLLSNNIAAVYKGRIVEHCIGQEILASSFSPMQKLRFWVREKKQSNAEVDYLLSYEDKIIPIEVKSGMAGRLRSLHQFMENTTHSYAIRLYAGKPNLEKIKTIGGREFNLLNLPWYLAGQLKQSMDYFKGNIT